jgi:hypothetical protein
MSKSGMCSSAGGREVAISRGFQRRSMSGQVDSPTAVWLQCVVVTWLDNGSIDLDRS